MEQQERITRLEEIILGLVDGTNSQVEHAGGMVQFVNQLQQYIRASRMMATVCLAGSPMDSDAERNLSALSQFLADIEAWVEPQDQAMRDWYDSLALANRCFRSVIQEPSPAAKVPPQDCAASQEEASHQDQA